MSPAPLVGTPEYERARHLRKKVEMLFAHLKRILRLGRLRLRGPRGARDEFSTGRHRPEPSKLAQLRPFMSPTCRRRHKEHEIPAKQPIADAQAR